MTSAGFVEGGQHGTARGAGGVIVADHAEIEAQRHRRALLGHAHLIAIVTCVRPQPAAAPRAAQGGIIRDEGVTRLRLPLLNLRLAFIRAAVRHAALPLQIGEIRVVSFSGGSGSLALALLLGLVQRGELTQQVDDVTSSDGIIEGQVGAMTTPAGNYGYVAMATFGLGKGSFSDGRAIAQATRQHEGSAILNQLAQCPCAIRGAEGDTLPRQSLTAEEDRRRVAKVKIFRRKPAAFTRQ